MQLALSASQLTPGTIICVHIPQSDGEQAEDIENQIVHLAGQQGKKAELSRPAEPRSAEQTSVDWMCQGGGISKEQAGAIIAGLGVTVAERLAYNAGTPRNLLGISATLLKRPEVLIYSTAALDPQGCRAVHQFVHSKSLHLCAVHISYPAVKGDGSPHPRICPEGAHCITLSGGS